jgi:undecaprenyl-diphosphatase
LWIIGFVLALGTFAGTTYLALQFSPMGWEYSWFMALNHFSDSWSWVFLAITFLGSMWGAVVAVAATFILKAYRLAWRLALTIIGAYGVAFVAKELVNRARPEGLFDPLHVRVLEHGNGFPSGHATAITVIMLTLWPYIPWKVRWIIPFVIVAVAASRIYLGVHVPLDVVGGVALGTAAVAFMHLLPKALSRWLHLQ